MQCKIINKLFHIMNSAIETERTPKDYGTGHLIYHSEINLLNAISQYPHLNAIDLADKMGVTRAAITQMAKRLEERGFIIRYAKAGNKKEKFFQLTEVAQAIKAGHDSYHQEANVQICAYLKTLEEQEILIIMDFLNQLTNLPISEFECISNCFHDPNK